MSSSTNPPTSAAIAPSGGPADRHWLALAGYLLDAGFVTPGTTPNTWNLAPELSNALASLTGKPRPPAVVADSESNWTVISSDIEVIQVAAAANQVFALFDTGKVFQYQGVQQKWWTIDKNTVAAEIVSGGGFVYARQWNGHVRRYNKTGDSWTYLSSSADIIQIAAGGEHFYVVKKNGTIDGYFSGTWSSLATWSGPEVKIIAEGDQLYMYYPADGVISTYQGADSGWTIVDTPETVPEKYICGGKNLYKLESSGHVFKWTITGKKWERLDTDQSSQISDIAAGGNELYMRYYNGDIFRWDGAAWVGMGNGGLDATLVVSDTGELYRISGGKTYAWNLS